MSKYCCAKICTRCVRLLDAHADAQDRFQTKRAKKCRLSRANSLTQQNTAVSTYFRCGVLTCRWSACLRCRCQCRSSARCAACAQPCCCSFPGTVTSRRPGALDSRRRRKDASLQNIDMRIGTRGHVIDSSLQHGGVWQDC